VETSARLETGLATLADRLLAVRPGTPPHRPAMAAQHADASAHTHDHEPADTAADDSPAPEPQTAGTP
ncbi:hypothetical protein AB0K09_30570, partial [Streptomyces sp. NPDC049577]